MAQEPINRGAFNDDPSAEIIRDAFGKVNSQFSEIYTKIPLELAGQTGLILRVNASENAFELVAANGMGDMLAANNLSEVDPIQARINLGLGTASQSDSGDFASLAQGAKADTAIQSIQAGAGVTVDATDAQNPIVSADAVTPTALSFDPLTGVLTLQLNGGTDIAIDLSDYTVLKIGGLIVDKDAANSNPLVIEDDDKAYGWEGDNFRAFKLVGGVRQYAIDNEI